MDSLTQIVLGASVAEVGLGKKIGNKALLWGSIIGSIPDLDIISSYWLDTVSSLQFHRGITHSFTFCFGFVFLLAWLACLIHKKSKLNYRQSYFTFLAVLITHALLDSFTTWGTQIFWPFSNYAFAFHSIFVVDPLYTIPFFLCVFICVWIPSTRRLRRYLNYAGLIWATVYLSFTFINKVNANQQFEQSLIQTENQDSTTRVIRYFSRPTPLNSLLWIASVELPHSFLVSSYSLFDTSAIHWKRIPKNNEYSLSLEKFSSFQKMISINKGYYTLDSLDGSLIMNDLRFGQFNNWDHFFNRTEPFVFSYNIITNKKNLLFIKRKPNREQQRIKKNLALLWHRIFRDF